MSGITEFAINFLGTFHMIVKFDIDIKQHFCRIQNKEGYYLNP